MRRDFQSSYLSVSVRPANGAELFYIAEACPLDEEEITLSVIASLLHGGDFFGAGNYMETGPSLAEGLRWDLGEQGPIQSPRPWP